MSVSVCHHTKVHCTPPQLSEMNRKYQSGNQDNNLIELSKF